MLSDYLSEPQYLPSLYFVAFLCWLFCNFLIIFTGKVRAHELREKSKSDLVNQLTELKGELSHLRIAQVSGGAPAKLAKIHEVRKNIARVLTVANQIAKSKVSHLFHPKWNYLLLILMILVEREVRH